MEFSRQEYWNGLPFPPLGDILDPGIQPVSLALAGAKKGRDYIASLCNPSLPTSEGCNSLICRMKNLLHIAEGFVLNHVEFMISEAIFCHDIYQAAATLTACSKRDSPP